MFNFRTIRILWIGIGLLLFLFVEQPVWYILFLTVLYLISMAFGAAHIRLNFFVSSVNSLPNKENLVALTFDDGPTPYTLEVLKVLKMYEVKASFFCIGKQIEKHPEILKQIHDGGHLIGNHTFNHDIKNTFSSSDVIISEIERTNNAIQKNLGQANSFFRPPFGVTNPKIAKAIQKLEMKSIGWTLRSLDTSLKSQSKILARTAGKLKTGDIVLFHDHLENAAFTTENFLKAAIQKGFRFGRIDTMLTPGSDE